MQRVLENIVLYIYAVLHPGFLVRSLRLYEDYVKGIERAHKVVMGMNLTPGKHGNQFSQESNTGINFRQSRRQPSIILDKGTFELVFCL